MCDEWEGIPCGAVYLQPWIPRCLQREGTRPSLSGSRSEVCLFLLVVCEWDATRSAMNLVPVADGSVVAWVLSMPAMLELNRHSGEGRALAVTDLT